MEQTKQLPPFKAHYIKNNASKILKILNDAGGFVSISDKQRERSHKTLTGMCECVNKIYKYVDEYAEEMKKARKNI